jgi:N-acyl-D-amino-acid deacylase
MDLAIRGGTVVDGTGSPPRDADVGVSDGRIVEVGELTERAERSIDASGCIVTPGFIDPHTHLDAQLCWDPAGSPSCFHGVTTVVTGLCGFGVAPAPADGGTYLLQSLERVEEIPYECSRLGVTFSWGSFRDYRRHLSNLGLGVNVACFVPHSALRFTVMGPRARTERATADDVAAMVTQLEAALSDGALGLATSRGPNHVDAFGDPVPSRLADDEELMALAHACAGAVWQVNIHTKFAGDAEVLLDEIGLYEGWTAGAGSKLIWTPLHAEPTTDAWRAIMRHNRAVNAAGTAVAPQVAPEPITAVYRFDEWSSFASIPVWREALEGFYELPAQERLDRFRSDDFRAQLMVDASEGLFAARFDEWTIIHSPTRPDAVGTTVAEAAALRRQHPATFFCDLVSDDELATRVQVAILNRDRAGRTELVADPNTMVGLGDAGAHLSSITNFTYPTVMLADLVRDRGELSLEAAVARMTREPARFLSLRGRGTLEAGQTADIAVIDWDSLQLGPVQLRHDLPGDGERLFQSGRGYRAVLVGGVVTIEDDHLTGDVSGVVF